MASARRRLAPALALAAAGLGLALPAAVHAQQSWAQCPDTSSFACTSVVVPLDRSGHVPGTVKLAVRRRRAPVGDESVAVFALAGGPGQGATALADQLGLVLGGVVSTRDLIVFDQRGTGSSQALDCKALRRPDLGETPPGKLVADCAGQIGAGRGDYTTADSVADLEAVRAATGYDKIVLYGTSYGTKVALDYARAYPQHVASLLLDSAVTPDGPDVFERSTFRAVPGLLHRLCAGRLCAGITASPLHDVARLAARLRRHSLTAPVVDGRGRRHAVLVTEHDLLDILVSGDLDPILRADFPAGVRSALNGDGAPLARLRQRAHTSESGGVDLPLFFATYCEEARFPWSRAAPPGQRLGQFQAALAATPALDFAPFDRATALFESGALQCFDWPFATPAPQTGPPLPDVPTLILSGTQDLRTPTSDARAVAAQIPGAQLEVVPFTGHSVLGSDPGKCAAHALTAFFSGHTVAPCRGERLPAYQRPTPIPPLRLSQVRPQAGIPGRAGRTAAAVLLTFRDLSEQLLDRLNSIGSLAQALSGFSVGGLRGGYARLSVNSVRLHGLSYVPGVTLSGTATSSGLTLYVGGAQAARGRLRAGAGGTLTGVLGGVHVRLRAGRVSPASALSASAASVGRRPGRLPIP